MFNWQPRAVEDVFRIHYFRIYLALVLPLTAVVLAMWTLWPLWAKHKQDREKEKTKKKREHAGSRGQYQSNHGKRYITLSKLSR